MEKWKNANTPTLTGCLQVYLTMLLEAGKCQEAMRLCDESPLPLPRPASSSFRSPYASPSPAVLDLFELAVKDEATVRDYSGTGVFN